MGLNGEPGHRNFGAGLSRLAWVGSPAKRKDTCAPAALSPPWLVIVWAGAVREGRMRSHPTCTVTTRQAPVGYHTHSTSKAVSGDTIVKMARRLCVYIFGSVGCLEAVDFDGRADFRGRSFDVRANICKEYIDPRQTHTLARCVKCTGWTGCGTGDWMRCIS